MLGMQLETYSVGVVAHQLGGMRGEVGRGLQGQNVRKGATLLAVLFTLTTPVPHSLLHACPAPAPYPGGEQPAPTASPPLPLALNTHHTPPFTPHSFRTPCPACPHAALEVSSLPPPPPPPLDLPGRPTPTLGLVLVDRSLDLSTPCMHQVRVCTSCAAPPPPLPCFTHTVLSHPGLCPPLAVCARRVRSPCKAFFCAGKRATMSTHAHTHAHTHTHKYAHTHMQTHSHTHPHARAGQPVGDGSGHAAEGGGGWAGPRGSCGTEEGARAQEGQAARCVEVRAVHTVSGCWQAAQACGASVWPGPLQAGGAAPCGRVLVGAHPVLR